MSLPAGDRLFVPGTLVMATVWTVGAALVSSLNGLAEEIFSGGRP